jgi:hypothetical protein
MAAFFSTLLPRGTRITARTPLRAAAKATLWPWLPRVALITPPTWGRSRVSRSM